MKKEYKNACENVFDCHGNIIVNHDVCKVVSTGEVVIVEIGINEHGSYVKFSDKKMRTTF